MARSRAASLALISVLSVQSIALAQKPPASPSSSAQPASPAPPGPSPGSKVVGSDVQLTSGEPGVTFFIKKREDSSVAIYGDVYAVMTTKTYSQLCTAPCAAPLGGGSYRFALSKGSKLTEETDLVDVPIGGTVEGKYIDRTPLRIAGAAIAAVGLIGGGYLALGGDKDNKTRVAAGIVIASVLGGGGLALAFLKDKAEISVAPGVASLSVPALSSWTPGEAGRPGSSLEGLSLVGRF